MEPWEALDVDDSDLSSLLRPCNRRRHHQQTNSHYNHNVSQSKHDHPRISVPTLSSLSSSQSNSTNPTQSLHSAQSQQHPQPLFQEPTPRSTTSTSSCHIPGPAGAVQAAMLRKARADRYPSCDGGRVDPPIPTQEYIRAVIENGEEDHDFKGSPWLCALEFLGRQDGGLPSATLSSIKKCLNIGRVDQVVAVIKSCEPNGLGDLVVTLKDPTGTVGASIHHKVLAEVQFGKDISVGSVLILQKVAIFAPSQSAHYLNITVSNVVKVISKDSGPPLQQNYQGSAIKSVLRDDCSWEAGDKHKAMSSKVCRTEAVILDEGSSQSTANISDRAHDVQMENGKEPFLARHNEAKKIIKKAIRIDISEDDGRGLDDINRLQKGGFSSSKLQNANSVESQNGDEISSKNEGDQKQEQQRPISRATLPEWTDEQLKELFAVVCEDDSLF